MGMDGRSPLLLTIIPSKTGKSSIIDKILCKELTIIVYTYPSYKIKDSQLISFR